MKKWAFRYCTSIRLVKGMKILAGPVIVSGYTGSAWLNRFFNFIFFVIKQAKMDFVFKLSFFLHSVANQNLKKSKISFHKQGKNRG